MKTADRRLASTIFKVLAVPIGLFGFPALLQAQEEKSLAVNGTTLHYVQQGKGEPVVLVHGAVSDLRVWGGQVPALVEAGFQTIAYTLRYFGTEPWPDKGELFSPATHADDLAAFVEALGLGPVHVVGWSLGGEVALLAALEHPELFRSMSLYEPAPTLVPATEEGKAEWAEVGGEIGAAFGPIFEALEAGDEDLAAGRLVDIVWETPGVFATFSPEVQRGNLDSGRTLALMFSAPAVEVTCEELAASKVPTLLLVGEDTTLRYFTFIVEEIGRCMSTDQTVAIPDVNHNGPVKGADAVNAEIVKFLSAH